MPRITGMPNKCQVWSRLDSRPENNQLLQYQGHQRDSWSSLNRISDNSIIFLLLTIDFDNCTVVS